MTHPKVLEAQVVGVPSEYYGEDIVGLCAAAKRRNRQGTGTKAVLSGADCLKQGALYVFLRRGISTASGKVQKSLSHMSWRLKI